MCKINKTNKKFVPFHNTEFKKTEQNFQYKK